MKREYKCKITPTDTTSVVKQPNGAWLAIANHEGIELTRDDAISLATDLLKAARK